LSAVPVDLPAHGRNAVCPPLDWLTLVNRQALVTRLLPATVHDVNNALQVMSGAAEVLAMDPSTDAVARRTAAIVAQAHQATAALQALTAFARDVAQPSGRVRPKAVAEQALTLRGYALRKARIASAVSGDEAECAAAHGRVLQVLLNLLVNAETALAGRSGATLTARVSAEADRVTVAIDDNGPGVRDDVAASLFTWPPRELAPAGGLGIGLLVSCALADRDGGAVTYVPNPGGGASFRLSLPR